MRNETVTKKEKAEPEYDFTRASSSTDCTGLIPSLPYGIAEEESYLEIYDYFPQAIKNPKERDVIK